jgi:glutathione S-transferase
MKLYYNPVSTFSRRVRVALLEKNIDCELVELNLPAREQKEDWYAALNPYTKVPTLVVEDCAL